MDGMLAGNEGESAAGDEVAGEENEIGGEGVDLVDDTLEKERLSVLVKMDVADLNDAITMKRVWQILDGDGALDDVDLVSCYFAGVESKSGGGGSGSYQKVSAGEA